MVDDNGGMANAILSWQVHSAATGTLLLLLLPCVARIYPVSVLFCGGQHAFWRLWCRGELFGVPPWDR